jgi:Dolichyl-phosphate-mannose-protein mannosyltransferase
MRARSLVVSVLLVHGLLLAWSSYRHSPVYCEIACLPSGLSHLQLGRFDLYRVNPPLVRSVAAIPADCLAANVDWNLYNPNPLSRPWLNLGFDFLKANGSRSFWYYMLGRWMCIPFSLLGGYVCFCWAYRLYGDAAGILATTLWCFCPYVLAHASLITPDAHAAAMGIAAAYVFWLWLREPCWDRALLAGLVLGLTELCKFTLLVFYPLWITMWLLYRLPERRKTSGQQWWRQSLQLSAIVGLSVFIINAGYCFEGSLQRLGDYHFQTQTLAGTSSFADVPADGGNRFQGRWLGAMPIPLPKNYLQGIDTQKLDFERGKRSYLCGEWRTGGWWYYYLYALAIKLPLGTWVLFLLAILASVFAHRCSATWRDEMVLLVPAVTVLVLVSSQTGFNIHSRYVLPMLPFAYVWISKVGRCIQLQQWKVAGIVGASLLWSISSSLWYFPHSLSYFNELVGGPRNGHYYLLDSNIAWGQDLLYLDDWVNEHPEASPLHVATFGSVDPRLAGIDFTLPPIGPDSSRFMMHLKEESLGPRPGWYAIDVNHLHSTDDEVVDEHGTLQLTAGESLNYHYFLRFQPVAMAGYSIYIYHITQDEANRVRRELGLAELREEGSNRKAEEGN